MLVNATFRVSFCYVLTQRKAKQEEKAKTAAEQVGGDCIMCTSCSSLVQLERYVG
jgi:hypothetical protein